MISFGPAFLRACGSDRKPGIGFATTADFCCAQSMNKLMMKTKRTLMRALVASTVLAAAGNAFADTIYDNFTGYNDFWHPFGYPNTATYGETFRAPINGDVNLQDFGFYMGSPSTPAISCSAPTSRLGREPTPARSYTPARTTISRTRGMIISRSQQAA